MLLIVTLVLVSWVLSSVFLHRLLPSESVLALGAVSIAVLILFQLGEVS